MAKEVDYKALSDKNKRVREFSHRKELANKSINENMPMGVKSFKGNYSNISEFGNNLESKENLYTRGLASIDRDISEKEFGAGRALFRSIKESLDNEDNMPKDRVLKYQEALARRGYRLVKKAQANKDYDSGNENILDYYGEHTGNKSSGLEKAATVVSLIAVVAGIVIGYPALTGNVIAANVKSSITSGAMLFVLGLAGVFIVNRK